MRLYPGFAPCIVLACGLAAAPAFAHALLDRAVPGVGSVVSASPEELKLTFTEGVTPAFSSVRIATASGEPVGAGKPVIDPGEPATLHVKLSQPLKPGAYKVTWHVVSVDSHRTDGSYMFKIAP